MKKCKWFLLLGVFLSYFVSNYLPVAWGWENSLLEWLQIAILTLGLILNYKWWQEEAKLANDFSNARFLAGGIPLWLLIIGRELSWGRVFYLNGFDAVNGPSFLPLTQLPYGPFVYPLLAVTMIVWLYLVIKYDLYKILYKLLKEHRFPVTELLITVLAIVVADLGEHKLHLPNMEEFDECLAYIGLILINYYVKTALRKENEKVIGDVFLTKPNNTKNFV